MIICKRPVPPGDNLQEAGPLWMIICKRPAPPNDHLQEAGPLWMINKSNNNNNKEEKEEEEEKFLRANGRANGRAIRQSKDSARGPCVADLKTKTGADLIIASHLIGQREVISNSFVVSCVQILPNNSVDHHD